MTLFLWAGQSCDFTVSTLAFKDGAVRKSGTDFPTKRAGFETRWQPKQPRFSLEHSHQTRLLFPTCKVFVHCLAPMCEVEREPSECGFLGAPPMRGWLALLGGA